MPVALDGLSGPSHDDDELWFTVPVALDGLNGPSQFSHDLLPAASSSSRGIPFDFPWPVRPADLLGVIGILFSVALVGLVGLFDLPLVLFGLVPASLEGLLIIGSDILLFPALPRPF